MSHIKNAGKALAVTALTAASTFLAPAHAAWQSYDVVLTIASVTQYMPCDAASNGRQSFGCLSAGDSFTGRFSVDSSILTTDGITRSASIFDFFLPFGAAVYSTGADNLTLAGFRTGPGYGSAPGFLIEGGQLVDWVGGVYGLADYPFIDMHGEGSRPRNTFYAFDGRSAAQGSMMIAASVPEPETYAMMGLGLAAVGWAARRRKVARKPAAAA